jgi:methionyl-tRNA formyltransferase
MQNEIKISKDDNRDILKQKIIDAGIPILLGLLDSLEKDEALIYPQSSDGVSYTRTFDREDLKIKWNHSVIEIHNRVRAFSRYPGCFSCWKGKYIKILKTRIPENYEQLKDLKIKAGKVILSDKKGLFVICGDRKPISIIDLKPPGKNIMSYIDFINGYKIKPGDIFE